MKVSKKGIEFLSYKRIYLRPFEKEDITSIYRSHVNDLSDYGIAVRFPQSKKELEIYQKNKLDSPNSIFFSVCLKKNDELIGTASLSSINWVNKYATYGRLIFSHHQNKGYGTELLLALKKYAFKDLNLKNIWTMALKNNQKSIKSNSKSLGRKVGILKKFEFKNGKYQDVIIIQHLKTK